MTEPMRRRDAFNPRLAFRCAITGKYVSRIYALMHPNTTISERRK